MEKEHPAMLPECDVKFTLINHRFEDVNEKFKELDKKLDELLHWIQGSVLTVILACIAFAVVCGGMVKQVDVLWKEFELNGKAIASELPRINTSGVTGDSITLEEASYLETDRP